MLDRPSRRDREVLDATTALAADAVEVIARDGRGRGHEPVQR